MKYIKMQNSTKRAKVDQKDFAELNSLTWIINHGVAKNNNKSMVRHIIKDDSIKPIYINGDKLDCRSKNVFLAPDTIYHKKQFNPDNAIPRHLQRIKGWTLYQLISGSGPLQELMVNYKNKVYYIQYDIRNQCFAASKDFANLNKTDYSEDIINAVRAIKPIKAISRVRIYQKVDALDFDNSQDVNYCVVIGDNKYYIAFSKILKRFKASTRLDMIKQFAPAALNSIVNSLGIKKIKTHGRSMKSNRPAKLKDWSL